jgi:diaminopimelate epimerase
MRNHPSPSAPSIPRIFHAEGAGNRFIDVLTEDDGIQSTLPDSRRALLLRCVRAFGRAFDSIMYITRPGTPGADFGMRVFEKDGSESEMCGNGVRTAALLHARENGMRLPARLFVETRAGLLKVVVRSPDEVTVAMPSFSAHGTHVIHGLSVDVGDVGEPHAVVLDPSESDADIVAAHGPAMGTTPVFKDQSINLNVARRLTDGSLSILTHERAGLGVTKACGTGSTVAACMMEQTRRRRGPITVHNPGGTLTIDARDLKRPIMTGPARIGAELRSNAAALLIAGVAFTRRKPSVVHSFPLHLSPISHEQTA